MHKELHAGNQFVVRGVCNPLIQEPAKYNAQVKFLTFYFKNNVDGLNYLFSELVELQNVNQDCYVVVMLSPVQYTEFYYLKSKYPELLKLNLALDKHEAGEYLVEKGHSHVCLYQELVQGDGIN